LLHHTGSLGRSVEILDQAASLFPGSPWPHYFKALVLRRNAADNSQLTEEFQRSLDLAPLKPEVYPAVLIESLRYRDCVRSWEIWNHMRTLGLACPLDPGRWCSGESSVHSRMPEQAQGWPEWRWIVDLARE
jgi:hypothetical protein